MKKKFFKFLVAYVAISVVAVNFAFVKVETAKADGPKPITSCMELQSIGVDVNYPLDGNYYLSNDINCSDTSRYPDEGDEDNPLFNYGAGFLPIGLVGTSSVPFTGTFDGNNYTIFSLSINNVCTQSDADCAVGIFSSLNGANIYDLKIERMRVESQANYLGSLAGTAIESSISNVSVSIYSDVIKNGGDGGETFFGVGGLLGMTASTSIASSSFMGDVFGGATSGGETINNVGGLVGMGDGINISNSSFIGSVSGIGSHVGGLVGRSNRSVNTSVISNSYSLGTVTSRRVGDTSCSGDASDPNLEIGGLVGLALDTEIFNSYSKMEIFFYGNNAGGLVGSLKDSNLHNSYYEFDSISGNNSIRMANNCKSNNVGGLVGFSDNSIISDVYVDDPAYDSEINGKENVGGLIGYLSSSTLENSFTRVNRVIGDFISVEGEDVFEDYVGGLIGSSTNSSTISNSYFRILSDFDTYHYNNNGLGTDVESDDELGNAANESWDFTNTWAMLDYPLLRFSARSDGKIKDCRDLQFMSLDLDGDYVLEDNIFCWDYLNFKPIGSSTEPFSGSLDGNGYRIIELSINKDYNNVGLFAYLSGSVSDVDFEEASIIGLDKVGVIAGESLPGSVISDVTVNNEKGGGLSSNRVVGGLVGYFSGSIASSSFIGGDITGSDSVGGLVGIADGNAASRSSISKSFSSDVSLSSEGENAVFFGGLVGNSEYCDISESYSGNLSKDSLTIMADQYIGGLVGGAEHSNISNTYSNVSVESYGENESNYLGGLVGSLGNESSINNSYSLGLVTASTSTNTDGGLVGFKSGDASVVDSFYNSTISGMTDTGKGEAKTSVDLKNANTFKDWDFGDIWEKGSISYPTLKSISYDDIAEHVYVNSAWRKSGSYSDGLVFGKTAFNSIDTALDSIVEGGTIHLLNRTSGNPDFRIYEGLIIDKPVNIVGENLEDGDKVSIDIDMEVPCVDMEVSCDPITGSRKAISIQASDVSIGNLNIIDKSLSDYKDYFSIYIENSSNVNIFDNNFNYDKNGYEAYSNAIKVKSTEGEAISDITILNNNISGYDGCAIDVSTENSTNASDINILNNNVSDNQCAMNIYFPGDYSDISISGNEIFDNSRGISLETELPSLDKIVVRNNKIYDNIDEDEDGIYKNEALYIYTYNEENKIDINSDFRNNYWKSEDGPNVYVEYYVETEEDDGYGGHIWLTEDVLIYGSGDENKSNIIIVLDETPTNENSLKNNIFSFRPFYKDSDLAELSKKKIALSKENDKLKSLLLDGTISAPITYIDSKDNTKSRRIIISEELDIEVPVLSSSASTTISLPANTEITKADTTEDEYFTYQDLSAAEMATDALSGFESGELISGLQWGIPSVGLTFSPAVTIDMYVGTALSGQTLNLYRSISTNGGWSQEGLEGISEDITAGTCLVSETGMCSFKTTKASYFGALTASSSGDDDDSSSSVSSAPISLPAGIGNGSRDITSSNIGATLNAGEIGNIGVNFLTYVTNQNNFSTGESSNAWRLANHNFIINSLDLNTETANITFHSDPKTINIKKGETKDIDLDNDKINDIKVTFSNIHVNRAEITVKSLSNTSTTVVTPPTTNTNTTEVIKITNDNLYNRLKGKIILKVEDSGKAYYVSPVKKEMYYLGRPADAFSVMRGQGIGITNTNLNKILVNKEKATSKIDTKFTKAHLGKIFIQTEAKGEAWYVNPSDSSRHYLGRPNDAFSIMRKLGLGISNADFDRLIK